MISGLLDNLTLVTATFNRHDFTIQMLESLFDNIHCIPNTVILDNSTTVPFPAIPSKFITVIDNTNFKHTTNYNQPSKNHAASLDWCFHNSIHTQYVMLCDNDIIFKPTIKDFISIINKYDALGEVGYDIIPPNRLFPYLCAFDRMFMINNDIHYFDETRCMTPRNTMDTGCSFFEDLNTAKANIHNIKISDYAVHLKGGSLHNKPLQALLDCI